MVVPEQKNEKNGRNPVSPEDQSHLSPSERSAPIQTRVPPPARPSASSRLRKNRAVGSAMP